MRRWEIEQVRSKARGYAACYGIPAAIKATGDWVTVTVDEVRSDARLAAGWGFEALGLRAREGGGEVDVRRKPPRWLRVKWEHRSPRESWGRFGGGWNWKLGFQAGGRNLILNLLVASVWIVWGVSGDE